MESSGWFQLASLVLNTASSYQQAKAQRTALEMQESAARSTAALERRRAEDAILKGQVDEQRQRLKTAQLKGRQRAALAARGIDLGEGSALEILTATDYMGSIDAQTIHDNAAMEAWGINARASGIEGNADLLRMQRGQIDPGMRAFGTLLGGSYPVAQSWYADRPAYDKRTNTKNVGWGT